MAGAGEEVDVVSWSLLEAKAELGRYCPNLTNRTQFVTHLRDAN